MASVRIRVATDGSETYQLRFRRDGKQESKTFTTLRAADKMAALMDRVGVERALDVIAERDGRNDETPTLGEWCEHHIATLTKASTGTRARYRRILLNDMTTMSDLPLDSITRDMVARWVLAMSDAGSSGKTIRNKHGFLAGAMKHAVEEGLILRTPCVKRGLPDGTSGRMVFLTPDEFAILLAHIRPSERGLVTTLVGTGLRWGEATALQAGDWDRSRRMLTVSRAWKESASGVELGAPKTKRSLRTIYIDGEVADILDAGTNGAEPGAFVFTSPTGKPWRGAGHFHEFVWQPAVAAANGQVYESARTRSRAKGYDPTAGRPWLDPAPKELRLGKRPRVHDLRHSAASWAVREGVPLISVQDMLGHESIKTTIDRYSHLEPKQAMAAGIGMANALRSSLPQIEG